MHYLLLEGLSILNPNIVKKSFSLSKLIDLYEFLINQALPIPLAVKLTYNELIEAQQNMYSLNRSMLSAGLYMHIYLG